MGIARLFVGVVLFLVVVAVMAAETARVATGGSRPVALRDIRLVFPAPPDVTCLLIVRGLPVLYKFFAIVGTMRAGFTLVVAPRAISALATALLATTLLAALLTLLPAR